MSQALIITCLVMCLLLPSLLYAKDHLVPIVLAKHFDGVMLSSAYWSSEKLDGIRCYWDGKQLLTRTGKLIHAPKWFIAGLPSQALDGELWAGRGAYQTVTKVVLDHTPNDKQWQGIAYHVFDLPQSNESFELRQKSLKSLLEKQPLKHVQWVKQTKLESLPSIEKALAEVVDQGGEGLMLRTPGSLYKTGRSEHLLKLKVRKDSEARVIAYQTGRGKYENMLGAVWVELENGKMFKIGTGFSDDERKTPPPIGSNITFSHQGFTEKGLPRFASFERIKIKE
jgi:DNA ligase-1